MKTEAIETAITRLQTAMEGAQSSSELAALTDRLLALIDRIEQHEDMKPLLTCEEAAEILRLSPLTVDKRAREGKIPYVQMGSRKLFQKAALLKWIATITKKAHKVWRRDR